MADPAVGADRLQRLEATCRSLGCSWAPKKEALADHAERIAGTLPRPGSGEEVPDPVWNALYEDLASLFVKDGSVLRGRNLLLTKDGTLGRTNGEALGGGSPGARPRHEAFFPPGPTEADRLPPVPAPLKGRLVLLHPGLAWRSESVPGGPEPARDFLGGAGLVRPFDVTGLLEHVRRALSRSTDRKLRLSALRFVFRLWLPRRSLGGTRAAALGLHVPAAEGRTVRANGGFFGRGWGTAAGEDLAEVVAAGQKVSRSLRNVAENLVAAPGAFVGKGEKAEDWRAFLTECGVTDGLAPFASAGAEVWEEGRDLVTRRLVRMAKVPPGVEAQWEPHIGRSWSGARYPMTMYRGTPAYCLPGQGVVERLGDHVRLAYARLVLHGLARWENACFTSLWASAGSQKEQREHVLTPLAAFVREQPWLPVRGRDRTARFARPAEVWHCPAGREEEPSYVLTCDHRVRPLLGPEKVRDRLRNLGMPTWDDPLDSGRVLAEVGRLAAAGALGREDRPAAQRAGERAWQQFVAQPGAALPEDTPLLVEVGDQPAAVVRSALDEAGAVLYVGDERHGLKALLVREMECPLLVAPGVAVEVAAFLGRGRRPGAVRRLADAAFTVRVDGERVDHGTAGEALVGLLPWLPLAVGVLADHATSGPRASEAVLSALTSAVRRVGLRRYRAWEIELDGRPVTMPNRLGGVLPLADPRYPLLLARQAEPH
ncbi:MULTISPECIES: hypothetical protein [unclassified Streptomyces]|uniref:hypothetical protein n=1 Tax=unclassified Streptomyces TaxID=2593676 RepID=UPI00068A8FB8|nr:MULTISPECIES: hypothetical protein [unclassified Streptomyces]